MGIGRFPSEYKIQLCHDAHPMIHAPRKCPIVLCPKVKEHPDKMESPGVITCIDKPMGLGILQLPTSRRPMVSYICAWIPMTSTRPSAKIITRCPLWRKLLTSSCTLTSSPSWMPTMDTGQLSLTRTPACFWLSTAPSEDTISCDFPLASSAPKTSYKEDGSDPWRMPRMYQNCRCHHHPWPYWGRTWCLPTRSHVDCPQIWLLYIFGHITWNLKSTLPTIQWICWGMHQVHQTHTPMSPNTVVPIHSLPC